jgi:hypothetical protein
LDFSIVAAIGAQLHFMNTSGPNDWSYKYWATVLCLQIAQNLSVITACLLCLHPFIVGILAGTTEPETVELNGERRLCQLIDKKTASFESTSLQSSPGSETFFSDKAIDVSYCHPLATYGLDRSSNHVRFPSNVAKPVFTPTPENIFNRRIEIEEVPSRPPTSSSTTTRMKAPKHLGDVGILPMIDWDSDSSTSGKSQRRSSPRQPASEYVFKRQQVVSFPDESYLFEDGVKRFTPPLPSPLMNSWPPPRAF